MQIIFPKEYAVMSNGCIAVVKAKKGPHRKTAGPCLEGHPRRSYSTEYRGKRWTASRLSYHLNVKKIPRTPKSLKRGIVCHHCDNKWCINPEHLYLGTGRSNKIDMYARHPTVHQKMSKSRIGNQRAKGKKWSAKTRERHEEVRDQKIRNFIKSRWTKERREEARLRCLGNNRFRHINVG